MPEPPPRACMNTNKNTIQQRDMRDFLDALSRCEADRNDPMAKRDLLRAFAELQFCKHGGSKCAICQAHVRHVLPVISERSDGKVRQYPCLCIRCFEGERAAARRICMKLGETIIHFEGDGNLVFENPHPDSLRRTKQMCL